MTAAARVPRRLKFDPVVRLDPGLTRAQAQAGIEAIVASLRAADPAKGTSAVVLVDVRSVVFPTARPLIQALLASAVLVLLVGCTNIATLFLVRTPSQNRRIGVQKALGATRGHVIGPLVIECLLIALAGGVAALVMTMATFDALLKLVPRLTYGDALVGVDWRVALTGLLVAGVSGVLFSAGSAWHSIHLEAVPLLSGHRHRGRVSGGSFPSFLVGVQVGLTVLLLLGAGVAVRTLLAALRIPLGFRPDTIVAAIVEPSVPNRRTFYERAVHALRLRGDVVEAGGCTHLPLTSFGADDAIESASGGVSAYVVHVLPGYFETLRLRLLRGRLLSWSDARAGSGVAVLSESAARVLFPDAEPVGGTVRRRGGRDLFVVGVVGDTIGQLDAARQPPMVYVIPEDDLPMLTLVARMRHRDAGAVERIRSEINGLDPRGPTSVFWWNEAIGALTESRIPRLQAVVLGTFGALTLTLTTVGMFGTVAFIVGTRTDEIAVRVAFGATPGSIGRLFMGRAMKPVALGIVASVVAARWAGQGAEAYLVNVDTRSVAVFAASVATVVLAAGAAAYVPAWRAGRVDAANLLRDH